MAKDFDMDDVQDDVQDDVVAPKVSKDEPEEKSVDYDVKFDMTAFAPAPEEKVTSDVQNISVTFGYMNGTGGFGSDAVFEVELPITVTAYTTDANMVKSTTYTIIRRLRFDRKKLYAEALQNAQHVTVVESINETKRMRQLAGLV